MLTFYDCQTDRGILTVAHVDPNSDDFASKINEASRRLMDYGDWWATVVKIRVAAYNRRLTWPRWVGTPLAISHDGSPLPLRNNWHEFLPLTGDDYRHIAHHYPHHHEGLRGDVSVNDVGTTCVFNNVPVGMANYILAYPRSPFDKGKTLTLWGIDQYGQPASETLTMPDPAMTRYAVSGSKYIKIQRVIKDASYDFFDVYQCADPTPTTLLVMAHYEPGETRPEYRVSEVHGHHPYHTDTHTAKKYSAMVKLQHIDAVSGNDPVLPENRAALKLMLLSIDREEASDDKGAETAAMRAIHELNRELQNKLPDFQIPISYEVFGGVNMHSHSAY